MGFSELKKKLNEQEKPYQMENDPTVDYLNNQFLDKETTDSIQPTDSPLDYLPYAEAGKLGVTGAKALGKLGAAALDSQALKNFASPVMNEVGAITLPKIGMNAVPKAVEQGYFEKKSANANEALNNVYNDTVKAQDNGYFNPRAKLEYEFANQKAQRLNNSANLEKQRKFDLIKKRLGK